jgi:hypothetical protein
MHAAREWCATEVTFRQQEAFSEWPWTLLDQVSDPGVVDFRCHFHPRHYDSHADPSFWTKRNNSAFFIFNITMLLLLLHIYQPSEPKQNISKTDLACHDRNQQKHHKTYHCTRHQRSRGLHLSWFCNDDRVLQLAIWWNELVGICNHVHCWKFADTLCGTFLSDKSLHRSIHHCSQDSII